MSQHSTFLPTCTPSRGALDAGAFHRDGIARGAGVASAAGPRLPPIPDQDHDPGHHHHAQGREREGQQGAPTAGNSFWSNFTMTEGAAGTLATLLGLKEKQGQQQQQEKDTEQRQEGQGPGFLQAPEAAAAAAAAAAAGGGPSEPGLHSAAPPPAGLHPEAPGGTSHKAAPLVKLSQQVKQPPTPSVSASAPSRNTATPLHQHQQEQPGGAGAPPPLPLLQAPAYRYGLMLDIACDVASVSWDMSHSVTGWRWAFYRCGMYVP